MSRDHHFRLATQSLLVAALALSAPAEGYSQDDGSGIRSVDIGLVGLAVDIEDGKRLGEGCRWRAHETPATDRCEISYSMIEQEGFSVTRESTMSMTAGDFGRERYRMAGLVTSLHYLPRERRARTIIERPGEVIVNTDGSIAGQMPATREVVWVGRDAPARVRATIEWSLYDTETGRIIESKKVRGMGPQLGDALYASLDEFVDGVAER